MEENKNILPVIKWNAFNNRKRPEFVEIKNTDIIKSGEKNDFPYYLTDLYRRSALHSAIINAKVNYIAGRGWTFERSSYMSVAQRSLAENLIKQPFADMDLTESTLRWTRDFEIHNMFAVLVKWSKNKRTATLEHIDVANLRTNEDTTEFYYTRKWYVMKNGKRVENKNFAEEKDYKVYPAYDPNDRNGDQIFFYSVFHPDQYVYSLPVYYGGVTWIENHIAYSDFQYQNITASFSPMMQVKIYGNIPDEQKQDEITDGITKNFTSPEGKRMIVGFYQSRDSSTDVEAINVPDQSTLYKEVAEQSELNICSAHEFPKLLLGITTAGALGQRNELVVMEESFYNRYVVSRQRCIEYVFNTIAHDLGLPINLKLQRVKSVDWMPSDTAIENALGVDGLRKYVLSRLGMEDSQYMKYSNVKPDANLQLFTKYGVDAAKYEVVKFRDLETESADEVEVSESEFMTFAKAEVKSLDRVVLDLLNKDAFMPSEEIAKVAKVSIGDVKDTIDRLREAGRIKYSPEKIAGDKVGAYELTEKGLQTLEENPAKTEPLKVMYRYELGANAPKLVAGGKSRPFCVELMDMKRLYSREDINAMSVEEGRNVWSLRGGWYTNPNTGVARPQCRHTWQQVIVKERQ
jgi:DNA-binding Lrp family transcriptional regulator